MKKETELKNKNYHPFQHHIPINTPNGQSIYVYDSNFPVTTTSGSPTTLMENNLELNKSFNTILNSIVLPNSQISNMSSSRSFNGISITFYVESKSVLCSFNSVLGKTNITFSSNYSPPFSIEIPQEIIHKNKIRKTFTDLDLIVQTMVLKLLGFDVYLCSKELPMQLVWKKLREII